MSLLPLCTRIIPLKICFKKGFILKTYIIKPFCGKTVKSGSQSGSVMSNNSGINIPVCSFLYSDVRDFTAQTLTSC